jgi:hypothetical protein
MRPAHTKKQRVGSGYTRGITVDTRAVEISMPYPAGALSIPPTPLIDH